MPALPLWGKAIAASIGALAGCSGSSLSRGAFRRARASSSRSSASSTAAIGAATVFFASRDVLQELLSWSIGDFSGVLRGRYEILFFAAAAAIAWIAADRFTVAGLGDDTARGLGLDTRAVMGLGVAIIAVVTGILMVVTGAIRSSG